MSIILLWDIEMQRDGLYTNPESDPQILAAEWYRSKCFARQKRWKDAVKAATPFYQYLTKVAGPINDLTQIAGLALAGYWMNMTPTDLTFPNATIDMLIEECTNLCGLHSSKTFSLRSRAADLYYDNGQYELAFHLFEETRKIQCSILDLTDERRIHTENFSGSALCKIPNRREEDVQRLVNLYNGRLSSLETVLGENNELTMRCRRYFATFLFNVDRFESALPFYEKQRDISLRTTGGENEAYWELCRSLANCYRRAARYTEAISLYENVLDWRQRFVGDIIETNDAAIETRTQLADSYDKAKRYAEATEQFKIILQRHIEQGRAEEAETNRVVSRLAENLYNQNTPATYSEAEPHYRSNLEWRRKHRSTEYHSLMVATSNVAECLERLNRYAEAATYYREWARMREAVLGGDDQKTMQALVSLGKALIR